MDVGVNEAGNHGLALQVKRERLGCRQCEDVLGVAHGADFAVLNGQGFYKRAVALHNLRVVEEGIGLCQGLASECAQERDEKKCVKAPNRETGLSCFENPLVPGLHQRLIFFA